MIQRENEKRKENYRFDVNDLSLATTMLEKMGTALDILYYLMNRSEERSFVVMMISANNVDLEELLNAQKRNTDLLFEINKEESIYTLICQDTKVDGGYRFAERLIKNLNQSEATDIYCSEIEVRTTKFEMKYIIFKLIGSFIRSKQEKQVGEIVYGTIQ